MFRKSQFVFFRFILAIKMVVSFSAILLIFFISVIIIPLMLSITKQMTLTRRLMNINKSPRRIDRKAGGRNKKIIIANYLKKNYEKKKIIY